jgi:COP9 signalosome complex subunit 2
VRPPSHPSLPPPPPQVNQLLEVGDKAAGSGKYAAMSKWAGQLASIHTAVCNKLA